MTLLGSHALRRGTFPLERVTWTDTTNIAQWTVLDEIPAWAREQTFIVTNVGYLVHEDDECVVLAARLAVGDAEPEQAGLYERVPKGVITDRARLSDEPLTNSEADE